MRIDDFNTVLGPSAPEDGGEPYQPSGHELEALFAPVSATDFAQSYFAKKALHVEGDPSKVDHIFGWPPLKRALRIGQDIADERFNLMASFSKGEADGSARPMFRVQIPQVVELLNAGATICITNIHMADPKLARWAQAVRQQLGFSGTVGANCYISPDGGGLPMHYDRRVATSIQIVGEKRWFYSTEAAKPWPDMNALYRDGRTEPVGVDVGLSPHEMDIREVNLRAGDLLCLPAGAWHAARGKGVSMAINLYFAPRNMLEILSPMLKEFSMQTGDWRGGPPIPMGASDGKMPDNIASYFRARLDEFYETAKAELADPATLGLHWLNALTQDPYTGWQPEPPISLPGATAQDRFRATGGVLRFIEGAGGIMVPCDSGVLTLPKSFAPFLSRLANGAEGYTLPDIVSWRGADSPSQAEIVAYLQEMIINRILEKV